MLAWALVVLAPGSGAATWADPAKTLRTAFEIDVTGFDPAATQDTYSNTIEARIFDALYDWDYLKRPYALAPSLAAAMPDYSADGRTWIIRLKPGVRFADDPAFKGQRREVTAADVVYSWKRLVDPRIRSPNADLIRGKLVGIDAAAEKAKATGRFDYDAEIEGLRAIDRHTLQLKLVEPDYTLLYYMNSSALRVVAREAIERYADENGRAMDHPVGSNAYRLNQWLRGQKVVLEANPDFREVIFPPAPPDADTATKAIAAAMAGKRLPQIGTIEVSIVEEDNPRLLMFTRAELDIVNVPRALAPQVMDAQNRLLPEYAKRGVQMQRATELAVAYTYFNMEDPVVGGYTPERVALRRAICSAYNVDDESPASSGRDRRWSQRSRSAGRRRSRQRLQRASRARSRRSRAPPRPASGIAIATATASAKARRHAARHQDRVGARPDGTPVRRAVAAQPCRGRPQGRVQKQKWPDLFKAARAGQLQLWALGLNSTDRRLLHAAVLRPERRGSEPRVDFTTRISTRCSSRAGAFRRAASARSSTPR
jgi:hypothetical protein